MLFRARALVPFFVHQDIVACIELSKYAASEEVDEIDLQVNQYVLELIGKPTLETGLEGLKHLSQDGTEEKFEVTSFEVKDGKLVGEF